MWSAGRVLCVLGVAAALFAPARPAGGLPEAAAPKHPAEAPQPAPAATRGEVRAVWISRWDYRSESDLRASIASAAALGLNRVVFQVRGRADAFYRSSLEPWGEELFAEGIRRQPDFDPLAVAVEEAKRRGIEIHAWMNVLPGWKGSIPPRSRHHLVHRHPDWFLLDRGGRRPILDSRRYSILNPCL